MMQTGARKRIRAMEKNGEKNTAVCFLRFHRIQFIWAAATKLECIISAERTILAAIFSSLKRMVSI